MSDPYNILYTINPIKQKYQYFEPVYSIILQLLQQYEKLRLTIQQSTKFGYPVIQLNGFVPIQVESRTFGAPLRIQFPYDYPKSAPYILQTCSFRRCSRDPGPACGQIKKGRLRRLNLRRMRMEYKCRTGAGDLVEGTLTGRAASACRKE